MKDIYDNRELKDGQINSLVDEIKDHIRSASDAAIVIPLLKDILDVSVKNNEHLVRLAAIVQKVMATNVDTSDNDLLSREEIEQLLNADKDDKPELPIPIDEETKKEVKHDLRDLSKDTDKVDKDLKTIEEKKDKLP